MTGSENDKRSFLQKINDYKSTPEFQKEKFRNQAKLRMFFLVFPILTGCYILVRKYIDINGYFLNILVIFVGLVIINFCAEYLTRKKFKQ